MGRVYEPDGSYYYCMWGFDQKIGNIIYYYAPTHQWMEYKYHNNISLKMIDYYWNPKMFSLKSKIAKKCRII